MTWTTERPTEPGWYWWQESPGWPPEVVRVEPMDVADAHMSRAPAGSLGAWSAKSDCPAAVAQMGGRWSAGRIPEPAG